MSVALPERYVTLAPSWVDSSDEVCILIKNSGFALNRTGREWVRGDDNQYNYISIHTDIHEKEVYLVRTDVMDAPSISCYAADGAFEHWGLREVCKSHNILPGREIAFTETGDENVLVGTLPRGVVR